ncbi:Transposon Ty3-I Gag-Pol polyprotein [Gossypium australe]|uniref:Transposon Ty3-I Gag-Pol polyprotein n=1 Tax=Gossypium australe TaxID=47621 RepID=A0A5B6WRA0_9ROSI|nr:Transposon Ty3-I Gag-Pol polyprotein [Gossypium australe]
MDSLCDQTSQLMMMFQKQNSQSLPSNMENNPRGDWKEHVKVIALRSGKELKMPSKPIHEEEEIPKEVDEPTKEEKVGHHKQIEEVDKSVYDMVIARPSTTKVPFSTSLEDKQNRDEANFLIDKIPKYAKYLKEIMKRHQKMKQGEQIDINASCSILIARRYTRN